MPERLGVGDVVGLGFRHGDIRHDAGSLPVRPGDRVDRARGVHMRPNQLCAPGLTAASAARSASSTGSGGSGTGWNRLAPRELSGCAGSGRAAPGGCLTARTGESETVRRRRPRRPRTRGRGLWRLRLRNAGPGAVRPATTPSRSRSGRCRAHLAVMAGRAARGTLRR